MEIPGLTPSKGELNFSASLAVQHDAPLLAVRYRPHQTRLLLKEINGAWSYEIPAAMTIEFEPPKQTP